MNPGYWFLAGMLTQAVFTAAAFTVHDWWNKR